MTLNDGRNQELDELLEQLCEDGLDTAQARRLEKIVRSDPRLLRYYLDYLDLHGTLHWDTALGGEVGSGVPGEADAAPADAALADTIFSDSDTQAAGTAEVEFRSWPDQRVTAIGTGSASVAEPQSRRKISHGVAVDSVSVTESRLLRIRRGLPWLVAGLLIGVGLWLATSLLQPVDSSLPVAGTTPHGTPKAGHPTGLPPGEPLRQKPSFGFGASDRQPVPGQPVRPGVSPRKNSPAGVIGGDPETEPAITRPGNPAPHTVPSDAPADPPIVASAEIPPGGSSDDHIVSLIDQQLRIGWEESDITPSEVATDSEWLRRVHLDLVGHIPAADTVETFLKDRRPDKRALMVDQLLEDRNYVRHWTTVWTNLLVGRARSETVDRDALQQFLRDGFGRNRPWDMMVADLISAEGNYSENGASNFLLAHVNNEAVPATAITARIFMGVQVQCTQCHNHPFNNWTQNQFWELNSFFQQTDIVRDTRRDPESGESVATTSLVSREVGGPIYYETRSGLMLAAFPKFEGEQVSPDPSVNRREELARLMTRGDKPQIAEALVNRLWAHFFGRGFTTPVDDMGPHNPPTHPQLLERLSREFVAGGYDIKRLIRWICLSDAYQRSSQLAEGNSIDNPDAGEPPLFSRVYVKQMSAEQLYDSLMVATGIDRAVGTDWEKSLQQREEWVQQFVIALETEENDEASTFDGTIPQALMMMNGELVERAIQPAEGTYFHKVATMRASDAARIRRLCLAALSRYPTSRELASIRNLLRERGVYTLPANSPQRNAAMLQGLQDVFWAYLNSNEFILVH